MSIYDDTTYIDQFLLENNNNEETLPVTIYTDIDKKFPKTWVMISGDIFFEIFHTNKQYMFEYVCELWDNIFYTHISYNEFDCASVKKIEQQFIDHMRSITELKKKMKEV